ncbi:hypothetical protein B0H67DRAFT_549912 [Lasiosphaeris hirsuta]|uniref:Nudix hydrolase domain-containing protein n=1 Tax=Lasiosphaeris hirsuta TaxID=260670 RepID=A0AA40AXW4_9PEZI|nr:hypothetical protein B0H67DRAFT_549912 [Lasiosphaeris hirsuta]
MPTYTNLDLVKQCDKFPYPHTEPEVYAREVSTYFKFHVEGCDSVLGFMLPSVVQGFQWPDFWSVDYEQKTVLLRGANFEERNENMGWRDELYPVYGGGIASGDTPFESILREATEEASFSKDYVSKNAKCCGVVSYFDVRDERAAPGAEIGLLQPECIYVYDLEVPEDFVPRPEDMEAEDFRLWGIPELQMALRNGEFKTNCALVLLDFFIRYSIVI